ncbi:sanA protein, partial [Brachyspira hampsonii]|nr:sanA protein [Brachyspira hampsonii]
MKIVKILKDRYKNKILYIKNNKRIIENRIEKKSYIYK